jgi:hypothetical protein
LSTGNADGHAFGTFGATDARFRVSADPRWAQPGSQPEQRTIRAQKAAPEIRNKYRGQCKESQHNQPRLPDMPEKIQHFHVGNQSVRAFHEVPKSSGQPSWKWPTQKIPTRDISGREEAGPSNAEDKNCV